MRPHVITHMLVSVDGRLEGFPPDVASYYELAGRLPHDAVLSGSGTMVAAARDAGVDLTGEDIRPESKDAPAAGENAPLLVVVDSRGQLTRFDWLLAAGLFRDVLVLGSESTPGRHRARLRAAGIPLEVVGGRRVDLAAALRHLREQRGVKTIRVDAGSGLNGALLAAGLLDEVSVVFAPYLVGHGQSWLDVVVEHGARKLELLACEPLSDGHVWSRYTLAQGQSHPTQD